MNTDETTGAASPSQGPSPDDSSGQPAMQAGGQSGGRPAPDAMAGAERGESGLAGSDFLGTVPPASHSRARAAPMDAAFTPIEPGKSPRTGPGWGALIGTGMVSALAAAGAAIGFTSLGTIPGSGLDRQLTGISARTAANETAGKTLEEKLLGQGNSTLSLRNDLSVLAGELKGIGDRVALFEARMAGVEEAGAKPEGATYFEVARAMGSLRARIGALEAKTATQILARAPAVPGGAGNFGIASAGAPGGPELTLILGKLAEMDALLRAHETALGGVRGTLAASADVAAAQEEVGRLVKRFEEFERGPAGPQRAAALYLVSALQAVGDSGRPFEPEFTRLAQILPTDEDVTALADAARIGAPTLADLKNSFPKLEKTALKAWNKERPSKGLFGWLDRLIANFVTIRRVAPGSEDSARDVLSRAGRHLQRDDLTAALGEMGRLKGAAQLASRDWTAKARARAELDRHVLALRQKLARDVAGLSASAPS